MVTFDAFKLAEGLRTFGAIKKLRYDVSKRFVKSRGVYGDDGSRNLGQDESETS